MSNTAAMFLCILGALLVFSPAFYETFSGRNFFSLFKETDTSCGVLITDENAINFRKLLSKEIDLKTYSKTRGRVIQTRFSPEMVEYLDSQKVSDVITLDMEDPFIVKAVKELNDEKIGEPMSIIDPRDIYITGTDIEWMP